MKAVEIVMTRAARKTLIILLLTSACTWFVERDAWGQGQITVALGGKSLTFDPFGTQGRLEVLLSNSAERTVVIRTVRLRLVSHRPYTLYTFPNQPLAPPQRVQLAVTLAPDRPGYDLYDIARSNELLTVKQGTATAIDVAVRAVEKGIYTVALSGEWYYFDEPNTLHAFGSGHHELRFPSVETWESVAHAGRAVSAYLTVPQSLTHFLLNMGLSRGDALSAKFGSDVVTLELGAMVFMSKVGNRYLPSFLRDSKLDNLARTTLTIGLGCGIDREGLEFYKSRFILDSTTAPLIHTRYVECKSDAWGGAPQMVLVTDSRGDKLLLHDAGMSWAHLAAEAEFKRYAALLRE